MNMDLEFSNLISTQCESAVASIKHRGKPEIRTQRYMTNPLREAQARREGCRFSSTFFSTDPLPFLGDG